MRNGARRSNHGGTICCSVFTEVDGWEGFRAIKMGDTIEMDIYNNGRRRARKRRRDGEFGVWSLELGAWNARSDNQYHSPFVALLHYP